MSEEVVVEVATEEEVETQEQIVNKLVAEALKNSVNSISETKTTNKQEDKNAPAWKQLLNNHKNIIK